MRSLLSRYFGKSQSRAGDVVAIAPCGDHIALVHARSATSAAPLEVMSAEVHGVAPADRGDWLKHRIGTMGLRGAGCRLVLDPADCRMLNVAAPEVPPEETAQALRWRIQDMIDFAIDEAEIEYFPMPSSARSQRDKMVTVAVCRRGVIAGYSGWCEAAGLELQVIDIPELCLRNLISRFPEAERGVALLRLEPKRGDLLVQKEQLLYVMRELDVAGEALQQALLQGDRDGLVDTLALEVQRSLDYYESYYGLPTLGSLVVAPLARHTQALVDRLNQTLGVISRAMDVSALVPCREPLDDATQQACLPAIGALLRGGAP